jgi:hypothetical protein
MTPDSSGLDDNDEINRAVRSRRPAAHKETSIMNVHNRTDTTRAEILEANIEDARAFFDQHSLTLWDLCDCIGDLDARDAIEEITGLFNERSPAVDTIVRAINQIVLALVTVPFAVVEVLERDTRMSGGLGNAIKYYGPRLADVSTHLLRASYGG